MSVRSTRISGSGGHGIWVGYRATLNNDATTSNSFDSNAQTTVEYEN